MTDDDVSGDDMNTHEFSDDEAEAIISGFAPSDPGLSAAFDALRSSFAAVEPPTASGELNEFIVRGADPVSATADTTAVPIVDVLVDPTPTRRHPVFASVSAFAGTALGKIFIGASVAAAGVGGAAATGIETPIDVIFETPINAIFNDEAVVETEDDLLGDDSADIPVIDEPPTDEAKRNDELDGVDPATGESDDDENELDDDEDELDDDESDDDTPTTTTPVIAGTASVTHTVQDVGTISFTYDSGSWTLGAVSPAGDYVVDEAGIDDDGPDVSFVAGPIEIDVDVEVENGQIRVRVRTENDDTGERTEAFFFYPIS